MLWCFLTAQLGRHWRESRMTRTVKAFYGLSECMENNEIGSPSHRFR
jgi:hypothetical protein